MPSLLEQYLSEFAAHLGPLPVPRRSEELREIREHLQDAVTAAQKLTGQSESEVALNVLTQFGTPLAVSEGIISVWRRERKRNWFGLGSAFIVAAIAVCYSGCWTIVTLKTKIFDFALDHGMDYALLHGTQMPRHAKTLILWHQGMNFDLVIDFALAGLLGIMLGQVSRKYAPIGIGVGWLIGETISYTHNALLTECFFVHSYPLRIMLHDLPLMLTAAFLAWAVSRRRLRTSLVA